MAEIVDVLAQIVELGLWLKTIGAVVILWIIFQAVNFFINRRRLKEIYKIKGDMKRMEGKLDKILRKK